MTTTAHLSHVTESEKQKTQQEEADFLTTDKGLKRTWPTQRQTANFLLHRKKIGTLL